MVTALSGGTGYLGSHILKRLLLSSKVLSLTRVAHPIYSGNPELIEIAPDRANLVHAFDTLRPAQLLHVAAASSAEYCQANPVEARRANVDLTKLLLEQAAKVGCKTIYSSTDLVFDGAAIRTAGFTENDLPNPCSVYASTKREAEKLVLDAGGVVVRLSLFVGPHIGLKSSPLGWIERQFRNGAPVRLFVDEWRTPVYVEDVVSVFLALRAHVGPAIFHCGGPERISRFELGKRFAIKAGFDSDLIVPLRRADIESSPPRPEDVSLDSSRLYDLLNMTPTALDQALGLSICESKREVAKSTVS